MTHGIVPMSVPPGCRCGLGFEHMNNLLDHLAAVDLETIRKAYDATRTGGPGGKPMSPFFAGQRLRRVVREVLER